MIKKILFTLLWLVLIATPAWSVQRGGAGSGNDENYILGGSSPNSLGFNSISSNGFQSGLLGHGCRISANGQAEFQDITARGTIRTSVFEKDTISVVNGFLLIASGDTLNADMTALDASTLTIDGNTTFVANEVLRIKDGDNDEWLLVTDAGSAPTYTVTRDLAGSYTADNNPIWTTGTSVTSMGVGTGDTTGFLLLDASSAYSPFFDIYARNSNTYNDYSLKVRLGWLKGIVDSDVGLNNTDTWGLYTDNAYLKGTVVAESGKIGGWTLDTYEIKDTAGNTGMNCNVTAGDDVRFWAGGATPSTAPFNVTEAGVLTASSGTVGGWTLGTTTLTGSNLTLDAANQKITAGTGNDIVTVDAADATYRLGIGHATLASAPFRVSKAGAVTATSGTIGGFTLSSTTLANGTDIILDASNKAISINNATWQGAGIQMQYNSGTPRFYVGDGANKYLEYDGSNLNISVAANAGGSEGVVFKNGSRWLYDFNPAYNGTVTPDGYNTFLGFESGNLNMGSTATSTGESSYNIGVGYKCLYLNTTGYKNVGIGYQALYDNDSGSFNCGIGFNALTNTTSGYNNTGIGGVTLVTNTTGRSNTAIGYAALNSNSTSHNNVGVGQSALYFTTGGYNVAVGSDALYNNIAGTYNTSIGDSAGRYYSTGTSSLSGATYSTYLGASSRGSAASPTNEVVIGYNAVGNGSNTVTLGNTSITNLHCQVALTVDSDQRIKRNIIPIPSALEFIDSLNPVSYQKINPKDWPEEIRPPMPGVYEGTRLINDHAWPPDDDNTYVGLIAQNLEKTLKAQGLDWGIVKTGPNGKKSITYEALIMPLIKAVQELSVKVAKLEKKGKR